MNFHPHARARWEPIASGLIFAGAGFIMGWKWAGNMDSGLFLAGLIFFVVGLGEHIAWMRIVSRSYGSTQHAALIEHLGEADLTGFDPARISIKCYSRGDDTTHYLIDLPCEYWRLQKFAEGIERDNKTTAFSEWSGSEAGGFVWNDDQDYRDVVQWICDHGYGMLDRGNKLVITANGHDLFEDLLNPQFVPTPLTQTGYVRQVRVYGNTPKI